MARPLIAIVLATLGGLAGPSAAETLSIRIPLEDGRIQVRDVLESVCRAAGVEPADRFDNLSGSISVKSTVGRLQVKIFDRLVPDAIRTEIEPDAVVIHVDREAMAAQADEMIEGIERWLAESSTTSAGHRFGMTLVTRHDRRAPLDAVPLGAAHRVIVLVHGLDDPGWMWRDLAPALLDDGHVVLRFEYPNDQAIADSGDLLASEFAALHVAGVRQMDIVAHSMGGLVARDVLTRSAYYHGDGTGDDRFPAVDRLIMIGTPNHGSSMARLRGISEVRELVSRWISGQGRLLDALADGAGEAGQDLLPGSDFLRRLNARPHPTGTTYTIVAGRVSPVSPEQVETLMRRLEQLTGGHDTMKSRGASRALQAMVTGLGDGIVSINSARLAGVTDEVLVEANHIGLIVNVFPSAEIPPAIPIVLDRVASKP
jgi:pimeloyl-ACP methyl ester carboxylesterase